MISRRCRALLGGAALLVWALHAGNHLLHHHHWSSLLWACLVAVPLVGVGLLAGAPRPVAIGFLWLSVGAPLWLVAAFAGSETLATSWLLHLGGLAIAAVGVTRLGMVRGAAWQALAALAALQCLCRAVTPPTENVNMVFAMEAEWRGLFPSYSWNYLGSALLHATVFLLLERALARRFPVAVARAG